MPDTSSGALGDVLPSDRELEHALKTFELPVDSCSFDSDLWVALRRLAASIIPVLLDHPLVDLDQIAIPKELPKVFREHPVVSLTFHRQSRAVRGTKLVAQFRERHPFARPTNFEQTQRDFAVSFFPDSCGDFLAGGLGRLKPAFISHPEAHPPEPRSFTSVQPHVALLLLARGVRRRDYTRGGCTTASG